jgi:hypothetical protein
MQMNMTIDVFCKYCISYVPLSPEFFQKVGVQVKYNRHSTNTSTQ